MRFVFTTVLCALFAFSASLASMAAPGGVKGPPAAQGQAGGEPGGGPPDGTPGGGPPSGEMLDVRGCAYFDEVLGVWRLRAPDTSTPEWNDCLEPAETDWKVDFGPEGYCPDPCLLGDLMLDKFTELDEVLSIRIGKNVVGTFKCVELVNGYCTDIVAQTDEDGIARQEVGEWIRLTPAEGTNYGRPIEGKWVRVFGRAGETEFAVLAWEIKYPNTPGLPDDYGKWYWWRTIGQPWAKMQLLDCDPVGEP